MSGIFISYRRSASKHLARLIFQELRAKGYDVFLDVTTIDSGEFDRIILNQIAARPHFLLILSPGSLERCVNEGDWMRREIEEAFRLKRNIVPIFDEGFNIEQEKQYLSEPLRSDLARRNAHPYSNYYHDAFVADLCKRFLKQPSYEVVVTPTPASERQEVELRIEQAAQPRTPARKRLSSLDIMPQPFEWIRIPSGDVTLTEGGYIPKGGQTFSVEDFLIAKYPVTNAQFAKFIEAEGYNQRDFWKDDSWQAGWKQPLFWEDVKWNQPTYPVVGISWYEAMAFCNWLSRETGEDITLPMDIEWQRAAQGYDARIYPWGDEWDGSRCNNKVDPYDSNGTTPVTQFEGKSKGDSPFGVVDMAGNVFEWCLASWSIPKIHVNKNDAPILRGGGWYATEPKYYRSDFYAEVRRYDRYGNGWGFRLVRNSIP